MVMACVIGSDATGGGTLAAPTGAPALTVPGIQGQDSLLVGYALDGVSVNECTISVPGDDRLPSAGFSLRPTSDGTAVGRGRSVKWLDNPMPMKAGNTINMAGTSGANYMWLFLYFDVAPFSFVHPIKRKGAGAKAYKWSRTTTASGTNLTANTVQSGLANLFMRDFGNHEYEIDDIAPAAAYTTNPIIGLKVDDPRTPYWIYFMLPLTDVADDWDAIEVPPGMLTVKGGQTLQLAWLGETAEQPTAIITFKYAA